MSETQIIAQTISDLRLYISVATIKNPLEMIDDFERLYSSFMRDYYGRELNMEEVTK